MLKLICFCFLFFFLEAAQNIIYFLALLCLAINIDKGEEERRYQPNSSQSTSLLCAQPKSNGCK